MLADVHRRGYIPPIARTRRPTRKDSPEAGGRIRQPPGRRVGPAPIPHRPTSTSLPASPQGRGTGRGPREGFAYRRVLGARPLAPMRITRPRPDPPGFGGTFSLAPP